MPCNENLDLPPTGKIAMIYTAGTEAHFYRMIPVPTSGPCGMPTIHKDGSIEYPQGDPPDIQGYEKTGRIFRPVWPSCRFRSLEVTHPNGCIAIRGQCMNHQYALFTKTIGPSDCAYCGQRRAI
jgi:hypothetical protein